MPLVGEDSSIASGTLSELFVSLRTDLSELEEMVAQPRYPVVDPASLRTASELLHAARSLLDGPVPADRGEVGRRANLAYAVMLAVIDLVKSHTDGPTVPRSSKASSASTSP